MVKSISSSRLIQLGNPIGGQQLLDQFWRLVSTTTTTTTNIMMVMMVILSVRFLVYVLIITSHFAYDVAKDIT